jgi:hypothetical protein
MMLFTLLISAYFEVGGQDFLEERIAMLINDFDTNSIIQLATHKNWRGLYEQIPT